jgi:oligopeptide transport system substrate-binding protein
MMLSCIRRLAGATVLGALLVGLVGCAKKESPVEVGTRDGILYRGNSTEPESLDPHLVRGAVEWTIVGSLFEGLVEAAPDALVPSPAAAESWTISPDGLTYTFRLRAGLQWSDGRALTAEDFVRSAQRLLSPRLAASHAENNLFFVRGAREFQAGRLTDFAQVGIRAPDAQTVVFELERPTPFFLSALMLFFPVPAHVVERYGGFDDRGNPWSREGRLVGNGPFQLKAWRPNQAVVLERNPRYRDAGAVRLREVHFQPIESPTVEENAFRSGQLHLTSAVPLQKIEVYQREQPELIKTVDDRGIYFYSLNVAKPPLNDARVRRALALAIDRETLVSRVIKGGKRAAAHFTPPGLVGYEPPAALRFDPAEARRLLAAAGFPDGKGFPAVELLIDARDHHRVVAEAIQQMWRTHLGVEITLRNEETQVLNSSKRRKDFQMVRGSWNATTYQDPIYFLGAWKSDALYNEAGWSNARFDEFIDQTWTNDPTARLAAFRSAEEVFLTEMPAIPLFFTTQVVLAQPSLRGWNVQPFGDRRLKYLWLEAAGR